MTSSVERWACDTSVAIPALDANHEAHAACRRVLIEQRPALAGHAAFETYAVLTRLPLPLRLQPRQAAEVLAAAFPEPCWLEPQDASVLLARFGELGLAGGSTYDALVGASAHANGRRLFTRDRRAERTYRAIGVDYAIVE